MNKDEILQLYDAQERQNSVQPSYRRETAPGVVRHVCTDPSRSSFIIYSDLTAANTDSIIREQLRWYEEQVNGAGLEWKTYDHDTPPDLQQRLAAHSFVAGEREALLILDLEDCTDDGVQNFYIEFDRSRPGRHNRHRLVRQPARGGSIITMRPFTPLTRRKPSARQAALRE